MSGRYLPSSKEQERKPDKMNRSKKNVRLNIYLTNEDKQILNQIKYKYQLSYSTIARLIGENLLSVINDVKELDAFYMYPNDKGQTKTSIKPRKFKGFEVWVIHPTIFYTNVIKLFTRNNVEKKLFLKESKYKKFQKDLEKAFKEEKDPNWNGNEWQRRMPRLIKQNKPYYRKLLDLE